jgi:tRNA threonylcarbamoyladenosine biosynthesis protein TsaB
VLLLGLDTATPAVTVALHDGTQALAESTTVDKHRHAELLSPAIAQVLADAGADRGDLTAIAVGVGPGPYTGLRVGVVTARVLGAALGLPVHGVCSLDVIAATAVAQNTGTADGEFLVATDARRRELYWARYDGAGQRLDGPHVSLPADIPAESGYLPAVGEGPLLYPDLLARAEGPVYPAATALCHIVARGHAKILFPEPLYLRRPDAREPGAPKRVTETKRGTLS